MDQNPRTDWLFETKPRIIMQNYQWYQMLNKPSFAPPSWVFAPVWSFLYLIIFISFGYTFYLVIKKRLSVFIAIPFILNLATNILFTPIQFGLKNNYLAAIDISLVLITLIWAMKSILPYSKKVYYAQIPYLLWVCFATILQFSVTLLNR